LMKEDPRFIQAWLTLGERIVWVHKKEAKKPNRSQFMMEQDVQWHPPPHTQRHKPRKTTRHQKQDLRPDWQTFPCPPLSAVSGSTTHVG
jgi:hypothetical protein